MIDFFFYFNLILVLILLVLVLTDERFSNNRKFLFILISLFFWIISLFIDKTPFLIIKDLFWYSLVLNGSFVFHVLILSRIFNYCWKKHYEYAGFLISRISYFCSIWGIIYIIKTLLDKKQFLALCIIQNNDDDDLYIDFDIKKTMKTKKIVKFMIEFCNKHKNFDIIYFKINYYLTLLLWLILCVLIHFSLLFHNYSLLLMGKNLKNYSIKSIMMTIIIFILLLSISIKMGIARLYIWWILLLIIEMYKIFTFQYLSFLQPKFLKKTWVEKFKMSYDYHWESFFKSYYKNKYYELAKIFRKVYHPFFMFDLYKFLYEKYPEPTIFDIDNTRYEYQDENFIYPINKVYKYYPWEKLALGYLKVDKLKIDSPANEYEIYWTDEETYLAAEKWIKLINIKEENQFLEKVFIIFYPDFADYSSEGNILYIEEVKKLIESKKQINASRKNIEEITNK